MTSIEVPYSIAAALPTLSVFDITNEVTHALERSGRTSGIAYVSALHDSSLVRVGERESGFFCDFEDMLGRLVPLELGERERLVLMLLGPRTEQIPFVDGRLCLGTWQRVLLFGFGERSELDWRITLVG